MRQIVEEIKSQRGNSTGETIWGILVFGLIIWGVFALIGHFTRSTESEGTVKYDDCKQIITTKQGSSDTYGKNFTCNTYKSKSGRLISGICVHIDTENGACTKAFVYEKKSEFNCGDNSAPNYDDSVYACSCNDGYHVDPKDNTKCLIGYPSDTPTPTQTGSACLHLTQNTAIQAVKNLPQVQDFLKRMQAAGQPTVISPDSGKIDLLHDATVWTIHVAENHSDHLATFNWYYVNGCTGDITDFNGVNYSQK